MPTAIARGSVYKRDGGSARESVAFPVGSAALGVPVPALRFLTVPLADLALFAAFAALAVVQMVGNTVGMAVPTPGGLGAVEAALTAGLSTIGVATAVAVPAVLLFRLVSFWAPILPGWIFWTQLQRRNIL